MATTGVTEAAHLEAGLCTPPMQPPAPQLHLGISREWSLKIPDPASTGNYLGASLQRKLLAGSSAPHARAFSHALRGQGVRGGKTRQLLASWGIFQGGRAVINAQPASGASLRKPGWCRLLWGTSLCPSLVVRGSGSPAMVSVGNSSLRGGLGACF